MAKEKTDYERVLDVYNSLPEKQKLLVAPRGNFVDSPNLLYRQLAPDDAGFVELYRMPTDKSKAFLTIATRPEFQGTGIGTRLLAQAIAEAKQRADIKSILYRTAKSNKASAKLGSSAGKLLKRTKEDLEYEIDTSGKSDVDKETKRLIEKVINAYKKQHGVDLSYMQFESSPVAHFNNGKPVPAHLGIPAGGSWTKHKKIYLAPDMSAAMKAYGVKEDPKKFKARIIAHELGHEVFRNKADKAMLASIAAQAQGEGFTTPYLKTVAKDKLAEETFAEYLAQNVINKMKSN